MSDLTVIPKPQNVTEAMSMASMISKSSFAPKGMAGKPGDILLAWQLGAELGLSLMQSLQNIAVINGKPTIYGDAALAVVQSHPDYINHREWFEGHLHDCTRVAYCAITRKNSEEHIVAFSIQDAKRAQLYNKSGVWQQYPDRMLQMRARGFAIRDKFSDALRGIITREEAEDYSQQPVVEKPIVQLKPVNENIGIEDQTEVAFDFSRIESCTTVEELRELYIELKELCKDHSDHLKILNGLTNDHKKYLEDKGTEQFLKEFKPDELPSIPANC